MKHFEIDGQSVEEKEFQLFLDALEMDLDTYDSKDPSTDPKAKAEFTSYEAQADDGQKYLISFVKHGDREESSIQSL